MEAHGGHGQVYEGDRARVGVSHGMVEVRLLCFRWLSPVPVLGPAPNLSPSFLLVQAIFKPNLYPYNSPTFSNLVHSSHLPACEDGTDRVFQNVGV
jgi:hypothetical protein